MDDKMLELLTQIYNDMKKGFDDVKKELDKKADKSDIARLEYDNDKKFQALFDGYTQNDKLLNEINDKFDDLADKVEQHDLKIQAIEGGRK